MADRPLEDLEDWVLDLLGSSRVARLGMLDSDDRPRVLPITFALAGGRIWTAIDAKPKLADREPARVGFLRRRPEVAFTADHYEDEWSRLAWVQVLGRAEVHGIHEEPDALAALVAKYAQYSDDPPPGPLISIVPGRVLRWRAR